MTENDIADSEDIGRGEETRRYLKGAAITLLLTLAAFAVVGSELLDRGAALVVVAGLAVTQIIAHFHFFLHIDLWKSHRDDLLLILFTALILLLMVGGTIWILFDQWARMG